MSPKLSPHGDSPNTGFIGSSRTVALTVTYAKLFRNSVTKENPRVPYPIKGFIRFAILGPER